MPTACSMTAKGAAALSVSEEMSELIRYDSKLATDLIVLYVRILVERAILSIVKLEHHLASIHGQMSQIEITADGQGVRISAESNSLRSSAIRMQPRRHLTRVC